MPSDYRPPGRYVKEGKLQPHRKGTKFWRKVNRKQRGPKPTHASCRGKRKEIIVIPEHTRCVNRYKAFRNNPNPCGLRGSRQCTGRTSAGKRCKINVCKPHRRCRHHTDQRRLRSDAPSAMRKRRTGR